MGKLFFWAVVLGCGALLVTAVGNRLDYVDADGWVTVIETECFIKSSRQRIVEKDTNKMAYMNCNLAPAVASQFDQSEPDIRKRVKVHYQYLSPIDGNYYNGTYTTKNLSHGYTQGMQLTVKAHKTKLEKSYLN